MLQNNDKVMHQDFGIGTILSILPDSVLVRFENNSIQQCPFEDLKKVEDVLSQLNSKEYSDSEQIITKVQSAIIQTINNKWGIFSRSAIDLLPHQLWVCNQVLKEWPVRYLVADDVGLGKTIEAGLMIWSLKSSGKAKRILILTPAPLTIQWQERMSLQFDLGFDVYTTEQEKSSVNYWETHDQVIVSFPTMQVNTNGRQNKILDSDAWDLVIVDEAHHMNAEARTGKTLEYQFFEKLEEAGKIISTVLFTGTPHRGFDYGFWSLMRLVAPKEFNPKEKSSQQYARLSKYFIRNNKQNTVDMNGNKLFHKIIQHQETFSYTPEEQDFYQQMSQFIESGKTYALTKSGNISTCITLVLVSFQKLAASSIAAVKKALIDRKNELNLVRVKKEADEFTSERILSIFSDEPEEEDIENIIGTGTVNFSLMNNEIESLDKIIDLADKVSSESRIQKIINTIAEQYSEQSILFFTEYKTTQSLLMSALMKKWGPDCVTIINGDEKLDDILYPNGERKKVYLKRTEAAKMFNSGKVRFLISTEAAGEGIDLQEHCHVLFHVDLPWNPMKLHQRVGRINRYGQKYDVDVVSFRNPDTIESTIWEKLQNKINTITKVLNAGMEEPDDLLGLVLGIHGDNYFNSLISDGITKLSRNESIDNWFDAQTKTFGGEDAISMIKGIVGNAAKFNLSGLPDVPKTDLPDLQKFFEHCIRLQGRQIVNTNGKYSFLAPKTWEGSRKYMPKYSNLMFKRKVEEGEKAKDICGIGHYAFDKCLEYADRIEGAVCKINGNKSYFIYKLFDQKTYSSERITKDLVVYSYSHDTKEINKLTLDETLKLLNQLEYNSSSDKCLDSVPQEIESKIDTILKEYSYALPAKELQFVLAGSQ